MRELSTLPSARSPGSISTIFRASLHQAICLAVHRNHREDEKEAPFTGEKEQIVYFRQGLCFFCTEISVLLYILLHSKFICFKADEMVQQVQMLGTKLHNLSSSPRVHIVEGENRNCSLTSTCLSWHALALTHIHTHTHKIFKKRNVSNREKFKDYLE